MADDSSDPHDSSNKETRSDAGPAGPSRPEATGGIQGKRLGDFELIRELGRGGMGIVYEARQVSLNRRVALKILPPGLGLTPEARIRFEREAHAAARLHHTNIVPVHAFGEQDGYHFYAMDLVQGQPLNRILDDLRGGHANVLLDETLTARPAGPVEAGEPAPSPGTTSGATTTGGREWFDTAARLVADVAEALDYAHGRGVIHRDIKPANLLFSQDGRLSIADFGLARVAQEPGMTVSGSLLGSPAYMSPEQIAAGRMKLDHRTDVYSLGAVLYQMLTLRHPFPGETREEIITGILTKEPKPPRRWDSKIPLDLETICLKAMDKDPDRRYQTAGLFAQDLRQYLQRGLIAARRAGPLRRTAKWVRRHPVVSLGVAAAAVVAILGGVALQQGFGRTEANAWRLVADAELRLREGTYRQGLSKVNEALALMPGSLEAKKTKARLLLELRHDRELANLADEILASHPDDWEAHAWLASAGRYGGLADIPAQEHVEAVKRLAPDTAEAWRLRGLMSAGRLEAVECFDRALDLDPAHYWALVGRVEAYIELKKFPEAVADAERAIVARPRSPRGRSLLARVYADGFHDTERALAEYDKAIAIDPEDPIPHSERSWVHYNQESYDKQLADTTKALELERKRSSSYLSVTLADRGDALYQVGRYDEALSDARHAIEIEPHRWDGYGVLLNSLLHLRRFDELRTAMEELGERTNSWADSSVKALAWAWISIDHAALGEYDQAIPLADRAVELAPDEPYYVASRARLRQQREGNSAFEADCDLIARLEPKEPEPLLERSRWLWWSCDRVDEPLAGLTRVIAMAPAWADAYSERGMILRIEGAYHEALADHDRAIALAPKWPAALEQRAAVNVELEQWPQVLTDLEQYFAHGGGSADARWFQANALAQLGREEEALAALDHAIGAAPQNEDGYWYKAEMLFNLGRLDHALATIDAGLEVAPTSGWAHLSRARFLAYRPGSCAAADSNLKNVRELGLDVGRESLEWKGQEAMIRTFPLGFTCPELAQPARSLELVREGGRSYLRPRYYQVQQILGVVMYANGRYEEAKETILKALELQANPDPVALFFLAMTESKLGRPADARRIYNRAVGRMEETWPKSPDLVLLREEAGKVVGRQ